MCQQYKIMWQYCYTYSLILFWDLMVCGASFHLADQLDTVETGHIKIYQIALLVQPRKNDTDNFYLTIFKELDIHAL